MTHDDDPRENIWFESVEALAQLHELPVVKPADPNAPELAREIAALRPDFLFSFYYRKMLPPGLLEAPARGALNMHGSLLPRYRGRVPVNWAVIQGERETGATLHYMVIKPDAGDIVASAGRADSARRHRVRCLRESHGGGGNVAGPGAARPAGGDRTPRSRRTWRAALTSADANRRMDASTGAGARLRSTTWSGGWPRPTPAPSARSGESTCGSCARSCRAKRRPGQGFPSCSATPVAATRNAAMAGLFASCRLEVDGRMLDERSFQRVRTTPPVRLPTRTPAQP